MRKQFGIDAAPLDPLPEVDAVLVINRHQAFRSLTLEQLKRRMNPPVLIDIKNLFDRRAAEAAGFYYRSL